MSILGEIVAQILGEIVEWTIGRLPRPVRIGCWSILCIGFLALVIWLIFW